MKGINLKKVGLLGIASLSLLLPSIAKAEKVCTTHKNYYFFNLIDGNSLIDKVRDMTEEKLTYITTTYFESIPDNAKIPEGSTQIKSDRICLTKTFEDGTTITDGTAVECPYGTWSLEDYYSIRSELSSKGKKITFDTEKGKDTNIVYTEKKDNVETNYYWHGRWYKVADDNSETEGGDSVDTREVSIADLVKGSFLPTNTIITIDMHRTGKVTVQRDINKKDLFDNDGNLLLTPFKINGNERYHAPAVYYIEYDTCEDKYNATINYYYYKDDKTTTDRVLDDNGKEVPAYTKNELDPGYTDTVDSPKLSGCTIVDANGKTNDADKKITISIDKDNPGDFTKNVYYYCRVEEETEPAKTGDALIYIAWAIGLGALGYSVYYFMNLNKEKKEEV